MKTLPSGSPLDETADVVDAFAGQEQDGRHIDQRIRTGTPGLGKAHGGAGAGHEDLSGQSRVVDAHVEREMLVGGEPEAPTRSISTPWEASATRGSSSLVTCRTSSGSWLK